MVNRRNKASPAPHAQAPQKDKDYTLWALLAIVAAVLITALFFAQPNVAVGASNIGKSVGGNAYATTMPGPVDSLAPTQCDVSAVCDGSKLIRQRADCTSFEAFCANGCDYRGGSAVCL